MVSDELGLWSRLICDDADEEVLREEFIEPRDVCGRWRFEWDALDSMMKHGHRCTSLEEFAAVHRMLLTATEQQRQALRVMLTEWAAWEMGCETENRLDHIGSEIEDLIKGERRRFGLDLDRDAEVE